jgi:hypothetical protein
MKTFFAAMLLGAVTVCCAHTQATKGGSESKEATFWKLCYANDGSPIYPDSEYPYENDACLAPTEVTWQTLPIRLQASEDYRAVEIQTLRNAVYVWNSWAGAKVFTVVPAGEDYDVFVSYGDPVIGELWGIAAQAPHTKLDGVLKFDVLVYESGAFQAATMVHELGHVLGLQHDTHNMRSIMRSGADNRVIPWLTTADARALQKKYGVPFERAYPDER